MIIFYLVMWQYMSELDQSSVCLKILVVGWDVMFVCLFVWLCMEFLGFESLCDIFCIVWLGGDEDKFGDVYFQGCFVNWCV